jgi:hypothetical protein
MLHYSVRRSVLGAVAALVLSACGGGGSSGGPPPGSYDLQSAMLALIRGGLSTGVTLNGSTIVNGTAVPFSGGGTVTLAAGTNGSFNGMTALLQTETVSGTVTAAGQNLPYNATAVNAYDGAMGAILGQSQSSEFDVASTPIAIPSMVGTSPMVLGALNRYSDSTLSSPLGTTQISVAVTLAPVDPGSPEVVQFTFKSYDMSQTLVETDTISYSLSAASALSFVAATAQNVSGVVDVTTPAP